MWSLFLFGHLHFIAIWQAWVLRINTKTTCVTTRLEYVLIINCMFNNEHHNFFGGGFLCDQFVKQRLLTLTFFHMNFDPDETKIDNIHESSQLQARWDNTRSDPTVKIACGVGSAPSRATQPYTLKKKVLVYLPCCQRWRGCTNFCVHRMFAHKVRTVRPTGWRFYHYLLYKLSLCIVAIEWRSPSQRVHAECLDISFCWGATPIRWEISTEN